MDHQGLATTLGETGGDTVSMTWLGETTPQFDEGGLAPSRPIASLALTVAIGGLILLIPQRPGGHPEKAEAGT